MQEEGLYRITVAVRYSSGLDFKDAILQIVTDGSDQSATNLSTERSGPKKAGSYSMSATTVVFLAAGERVRGEITLLDTGGLATDRGWLIIEKLTP